MKTLVVIILSMLWLGLSGQSAVLAATPAKGDFIPLSVGNRWIYESSEGTPAAPALETWEVIGQEGPTFVVRVTQPYMTISNVEELLTPTAKGMTHLTRTRTDSPGEAQTPRIILKLPPTASASWKNENGRYAITGVEETVTVPAGTFTGCIEVTHWTADGNVTVVTLYAPGIGMVQREERFPILAGIGSADAPTQGRTVLRLKEWIVKSLESRVRSLESEMKKSE